MKKKVWIGLAVLLVAAVLYVVDMFLGNPVSYWTVKNHSVRYLRETYPAELRLEMGEIYYDWYSGGGYEIDVTSPVSEDTRFTLRYNRLGLLSQDTYEMYVASGNATLSRLNREYDDLISDTLDGLWENVTYKSLLSSLDPYSGQAVPLDIGIDPAQLTLDGEYDVGQLGNVYGYLSVTIYESAAGLTVETAAEYLQEINEAMKEAGVGFGSMDVFLVEDKDEALQHAFSLGNVTRDDLEAEELPKVLAKKVMK